MMCNLRYPCVERTPPTPHTFMDVGGDHNLAHSISKYESKNIVISSVEINVEVQNL